MVAKIVLKYETTIFSKFHLLRLKIEMYASSPRTPTTLALEQKIKYNMFPPRAEGFQMLVRFLTCIVL